MDYGLFTMPSHPPERSLYDGHQWDLQQLRWADELASARRGSASTTPPTWEPHPSPRPARGPGAPCRQAACASGPAGSSCRTITRPSSRTGWRCSTICAQGRLNFGVAARRAAERLGHVQRRRQLGPASGDDARGARHHPASLGATSRNSTTRVSTGTSPRRERCSTRSGLTSSRSRSRIRRSAWRGVSRGSDTLKLAGERGFWPMSLNLNPTYVGSHWEAVEQGGRADRPYAEALGLAARARGSSSPTPTPRPCGSRPAA